MIKNNINKKQRVYTLVSNIILFFFLIFLVTIPLKDVIACSGNCPTGCAPFSGCGCTGSGGCRDKTPKSPCTGAEVECNDYCCDPCGGSCGDCNCSSVNCPTGYGESNTGCSKTTVSCSGTYTDSCCGSCSGSESCWKYKYTLTYTAGSNGSITGTTPQSICRDSNGTSVTAVPNSGYSFVDWSDGSTSNPRTDTNITANKSVTANFSLNNTTPSAPTSLLTEGATNPTSISDTTPEFSAVFNDSDTGDTGDYYQIQVNTASDFTGTSMWDSSLTTMTPTAIGARSPDISYAGTTLTMDGSTYYWRIRFADNKGATSPWSSTANFKMNTSPSAPTSLLTEGATNPTKITDTTPEFSAVFNDPDTGDTGNYYQIQVNTASDFTGTSMWDSSLTTMTPTAIGARSPDISYAGTTLTMDGSTYYWRIRFADNKGTTSPWSSTANFKMNTTPTAPTSLLTEGATNPTKITDTTPEFSAVFNDLDTGDTGNYYQIQVNTASDFSGTVMWDSSLTAMTPTAIEARSPDISYAGTTLTMDGSTYYWRIKFTDNNGATSPWSITAQFTLSGSPLTPINLLTNGYTNPTWISSLTPSFSAIYSDPNLDDANIYQVQVNTNNTFTGTTMWDSGQQATSTPSGDRSEDIVYNGIPLANDNTTYYWRIKFWDTDDFESPWSATAQFSSSLTSIKIEGLQFGGIKID